MYRELRALGAPQGVARRVAANSRSWWRNSAMLLNSVLTIDHFDRVPFDNNLAESDIRMPKRNNVYVALQVL